MDLLAVKTDLLAVNRCHYLTLKMSCQHISGIMSEHGNPHVSKDC